MDELEMTAVAYYERKAGKDDLSRAALKYASAVFHNRKSRERNKDKPCQKNQAVPSSLAGLR